jgi:NAD(P)-dependent dehydrogenase (short-subunit alcohol dehydrogenase family)
MDLGLVGKRAIVTGSTSGIGEGIARELAREGATVLVHGRRPVEADRVVAAIEREGGSAANCIADLSSDDGAQRLVDAASRSIGEVDILVNNAGTYDFESTWSTLEPAEWLDRYNVNVGSAVRVTKLLLPGLKSRGWGRVVNISSSDAISPSATLPEYAASKAALANITLTLARECHKSGVTVNGITPGFVLTPPVMAYLRGVADARGWPVQSDEAIAERALSELFSDPLGGWGGPEDIAYVAAALCAERARWITAADIRVDGGGA